MWENMVQPDRPQKTIWRMRISCCVPKAKNTPSEYVCCFSSATTVSRKRLNITLHVHYLSCLNYLQYRRRVVTGQILLSQKKSTARIVLEGGPVGHIPDRHAVRNADTSQDWGAIIVLVNSGFHTWNSFSENYKRFRPKATYIFPSHLLDPKCLKNISIMRRQVIGLPGATACLGPAVGFTAQFTK